MSLSGQRSIGPAVRATAASLRVDVVTAEVTARLRDRGVPAILLKGPSLAAWLYADGSPRPYDDSDLLVPPDLLPEAERVLRNLGFRRRQPGWREHAWSWTRRSDGAIVDLHSSLFGAEADARRVWAGLSSRSEAMRVGGAEVQVLRRPALAMHVAIHAAQHGAAGGRPLADLDRALALADDGSWRAAAEVADGLGATAAFSAGLRLRPEGARLADRLGLPAEPSTAVALHAHGAPPLVLGLEQLASPQRTRQRLRFIGRKLVPPPHYMRTHSRLARRGRLGLAAAYVARPLWMTARLPAAVLAWRRARR